MLLVTRGLPNPLGKDRTAGWAPNDQLNSEWIEFQNQGQQSAALAGISINHYTFDGRCSKTGEDRLMTFKGFLAAGHSVRVHTGTGDAWDEGTVRHLYAGRSNYAWNNACGDTAVLRNVEGNWIDYAAYDPNPPEGVVVNRVPGTHQLVPYVARRTA
jgi:hypothetical protein